MRALLTKRDVKARCNCKTDSTIKSWIQVLGFPPGFILGRNRVWYEDDVEAWIASRPATKRPLRGLAKRIAQDPSVGIKQAERMRLARTRRVA